MNSINDSFATEVSSFNEGKRKEAEPVKPNLETLICKYCDFTSLNKWSFMRHMQRSHKDVENEPLEKDVSLSETSQDTSAMSVDVSNVPFDVPRPSLPSSQTPGAFRCEE